MKFVSTMIKSLYHDSLLNQSVAVFTHVLQDLVSSIVAGCGGGLGGHSQRVDQSLEGEQSNSHSSWESCFHVIVANGFLALVDIVEQHADLLEDDSVRCPLAAGGWGDPLELEECRFVLWAEGWPARAREIDTQKLSHLGLPVKSLMKHCAQISENWHHSFFIFMDVLPEARYLFEWSWFPPPALRLLQASDRSQTTESEPWTEQKVRSFSITINH